MAGKDARDKTHCNVCEITRSVAGQYSKNLINFLESVFKILGL